MRLKDKVAIVTGAARGIGFACAKVFADEGAKVVLGDVLTDLGAKAAKDIDPSGKRAVFVKCDVTSQADVQGLVDTAVKNFGGLDLCVANAAINLVKDVLEITLDEWNKVIAVNLTGVFLTCQAAAKQMVKQGRGGAIINMSSCNAIMAIPTIAPYAASKGGINQLTRAMSISMAAHGIRVNAIGPGSIATDMVKQVATDPKIRHAQMARTPLGRYGEPEEVARVALFLASEDSSYITGQTIYPDGGRLALNYTVPVKGD